MIAYPDTRDPYLWPLPTRDLPAGQFVVVNTSDEDCRHFLAAPGVPMLPRILVCSRADYRLLLRWRVRSVFAGHFT